LVKVIVGGGSAAGAGSRAGCGAAKGWVRSCKSERLQNWSCWRDLTASSVQWVPEALSSRTNH